MSDRKKQMFRLLFLAGLILLFEIIITTGMGKNYTQLRIEGETFIGNNGGNLKDFHLEQDGSIRSVSEDPWLYYQLPQKANIKFVEIFIDEISLEDADAQLFFIQDDSVWVHQDFNIHSGANKIQIGGGQGIERVTEIRFDLVSAKDVSVKVEKVIINNKYVLCMNHYLAGLLIILGYMAAVFSSGRAKRYRVMERRQISIGILIFSVTAVFLLDAVFTDGVNQKYPQFFIEWEDLIGKNGGNLKDFRLQDDGTIISESIDPWSDYQLPQAMNIRSMEILVDSVGSEGISSELFLIQDNGSWNYQTFYLRSGTNRIEVNEDRGIDNVVQIRFDLLTKKDVSIKIDRIIINEKNSLSMKYHFISLFMLLFMGIIVVLSSRIKKYPAAGFREMFTGIFLICGVSFLICVFGPLDLYFNNQDEFWFDLYTLLPVLAGMFLAAVLAGSAVMFLLFLLHRRIYQLGMVLGYVIFLCTYIQGNFLVGNLPPLDGTEFEWSDYAAGRMQTAVLWVVVILAVVILVKAFSMERFCSFVKWSLGGILSVLLVTLCTECILTYGYQDKISASVTTQHQLEMSRDKNFVILVLDALDGGTFHEVLKKTPEYKEIFRDFTYYPDTMGAYSFTSRSIPFILSGEWFENKELFAKYNEKAYQHTGIFAELEKEDYKLGVYETAMPLTDKSILRFDNVFAYDLKIRSYSEFAGLELKLTGFKYAPFDLKKFFVTYPEEFNLVKEGSADSGYQPFPYFNTSFYNSVKNGEVAYTEQKCFKFLHIEGAHVPFRYDKDVNEIKNGTYEQNIEASVTIAGTYLEKLRNAGVYDNSVIIVMADHGYEWEEDYLYGRQNPLLMIKGIGEKHEMKIVNAPISFDDLQPAYKKLLAGEAGDKVFDWKEGDMRERRFLWFRYLNEDHMVEYMQAGRAADPDTMYPTGREYNR